MQKCKRNKLTNHKTNERAKGKCSRSIKSHVSSQCSVSRFARSSDTRSHGVPQQQRARICTIKSTFFDIRFSEWIGLENRQNKRREKRKRNERINGRSSEIAASRYFYGWWWSAVQTISSLTNKTNEHKGRVANRNSASRDKYYIMIARTVVQTIGLRFERMFFYEHRDHSSQNIESGRNQTKA